MPLDHLNENEPCSPSTLRQKLRSSLCIIPCFSKTTSHQHSITAPSSPAPSTPNTANVRLVRTSSLSNSKSRSSHHHHHHHHHNNHYEFAELRDKCKSLIGRMGRGHHHHVGRRHSASADFKYDALSYSLNFDHEEDNVEDFPFRSFSARLPPSPARTSQDSAVSRHASKEITACS